MKTKARKNKDAYKALQKTITKAIAKRDRLVREHLKMLKKKAPTGVVTFRGQVYASATYNSVSPFVTIGGNAVSCDEADVFDILPLAKN